MRVAAATVIPAIGMYLERPPKVLNQHLKNAKMLNAGD
jgi:hypothetical protein